MIGLVLRTPCGINKTPISLRVCRRTHTLVCISVFSLCDIAGAHDGTIFIRSFARPGDLLLILTLFGLLVGGEWWFRRVFYIARFVLFAWDRAARFNSVRTAAGQLLFSVSSSVMMEGIEIIWIFLSMNYLSRRNVLKNSCPIWN